MQARYSSIQANGIRTNNSKWYNILLICLIVLNCLTFGITMFMNAAASNPKLGIVLLLKC